MRQRNTHTRHTVFSPKGLCQGREPRIYWLNGLTHGSIRPYKGAGLGRLRRPTSVTDSRDSVHSSPW
jgi:hypothetical protein